MLVTEFRRHVAADSSVGMSVKKDLEMIKTGLEFLNGSYGSSRYNLKWLDNVFYFETTRQAPNSTASDAGSLRCITAKGTTLAWLTRARSRNEDLDSPVQLCATIWFETIGISEDLIDMIISSFLAITDIQYPNSPRNNV
ncbi:protein of unknown function [Taphrina deformans PYCC 5710]|uniref:Uncharacterized protein n=1 Tax=Taphrina deformans (strain PYCC 5710 / ATCC 11124 / CBS 356.35 / IMI 108563 / JCM 9778 / NBRC 8474) TaxID=1097556 RepID=R4XGI3_TAPDE|nr:protein of unknown function [Taphrina deformans PYCC 5710]|eukprot:CCG84757.1 protein of unknown function [Taphrina deformans PYCC 5710]